MEEMQKQEPVLLECEKLWIFAMLIAAGGYLGAYTYTMRGGVFCNAQTANVVLLSMALGSGQWSQALYFLIPISAYMLGAVISELMPNRVKRLNFLRWDTLLVGLEMLVTFLLGFIPDSWPYQICQVSINFICSMQYNTFRQAEHIPMATTFCTNHIRQVGVFLTKWLRHPGEAGHRRHCVPLSGRQSHLGCIPAAVGGFRRLGPCRPHYGAGAALLQACRALMAGTNEHIKQNASGSAALPGASFL